MNGLGLGSLSACVCCVWERSCNVLQQPFKDAVGEGLSQIIRGDFFFFSVAAGSSSGFKDLQSVLFHFDFISIVHIP